MQQTRVGVEFGQRCGRLAGVVRACSLALVAAVEVAMKVDVWRQRAAVFYGKARQAAAGIER